MKIKHWQGYGTVNAECVATHIRYGEPDKVIRVTGDHEWGLVRDDRYDLERWLLKRFVRGNAVLRDYKITRISDTEVIYQLFYRKTA